MIKVQKAKDIATVTAAAALCKDAVLEPKYDGWRAIFIVHGDGDIGVYSRTGKRYDGQVPEIEAQVAKLPVGTILDGELVAMKDDNGRMVNDCSLMTTVMGTKIDGPKAIRQRHARQAASFIVFDCIQWGEKAIDHAPLRQRREIFVAGLAAHGLDTGLVQATMQVDATEDAHQTLVDAGMEGSIVKCLEADYAFGKRGYGWFKIKCTETVDLVIMELPVDGEGQFVGQVGRMIIGQYQNGQLVARTKVNAPDNKQRLEMTLAPERYLGRVVEVKVYGWYEDGAPRHPTFGRWREDKAPLDCDWHEPRSTL